MAKHESGDQLESTLLELNPFLMPGPSPDIMYEEWNPLWHSFMRANVSENGNFDPFLCVSGSQKDGGSSKHENCYGKENIIAANPFT
ncbi:hypothetical protein CDAR_78391 [Caerostris darwini]|uniref:Uncharacterized protein n=1 Tax=Caerostris darwini TaxID=1538125 RepID=A0AAV4SDV5_9ARAC|nr:hypothetical protein CDAR_78391 [Caerostris darwini]